MPNLQLPLDCVPPYRLRYHAAGQPIRRGFWLDGRPVVIQLDQEHDDGPITARAYSTSPLDGIADRVREAAHRMISARDDLNEFRAAVAGDREMAALVAGLPGLRPLRVPDLWTALIWGPIDQQLSNVSGRAIRHRLAERFGPSVDVEGERVAVLPDARTILDITDRELCEAGLSERKAEYAEEIAKEVMAGEVDLERIAAMPLEDALQHIVDLRGVGMWTAEVAAIFGLPRTTSQSGRRSAGSTTSPGSPSAPRSHGSASAGPGDAATPPSTSGSPIRAPLSRRGRDSATGAVLHRGPPRGLVRPARRRGSATPHSSTIGAVTAPA